MSYYEKHEGARQRANEFSEGYARAMTGHLYFVGHQDPPASEYANKYADAYAQAFKIAFVREFAFPKEG